MSFPQVGRRAWNRAGGLAAGAWLSACLTVSAQMSPATSATNILQDLNQFGELGSVLYVAAHPDDENNQLIAYLARGRNYRTAYLSLTRGDGGQNVLGPQFGSELGVIRTEELLAARRVDGGRQYFSRAVDFGFSKDYQETLNIWDRQAVLSDIVRVIREFRPDVVINRFSTVPGGTHGHHTASAVLDTEAFKLAGDSQAFPEQLREGLTPWQPKRLFWNAGGFQRGGAETNVIRLNVGGVDAVTGESFADIAGHSRSMHKTQGFGNYTGGGGRGPREESFVLLAGDPATNDIMDGVDTTWDRLPGGAAIGSATAAVIAKFNPQDPAASVPALLKIKKDLDALPHPDPMVDEKRALLDRIIQACLGLTVTTTVPQADVVPGEPLQLHLTAQVQSPAVPVRWVATRYPVTKTETAVNQELVAGHAVSREATEVLPVSTAVSRPYWLREESAAGLFHVADLNLIGRPENPPVFPVEQVFEVGGQRLVVPDQPVQVSTGSAEVALRPLIVISPVSLQLQSEVGLFAPKVSHPVSVEVTAMRADVTGALRLAAPDGWQVQPATQAIHLRAVGDQTRFTFTVTAPAEPTTAGITAVAEIGGRSYDNERTVVDYPHIPRLVWQPPARLKAVCLNLAVQSTNIGYLPGAGDDVAQCVADMGCTVTSLTGADLTTNRLKDFDAVIIGVRAFNVRTDLVANLPALFAYVAAGGNVIEQYNRPGRDLKSDEFTPYRLRLSNDRVTDETAPVTFLAPEHPALTTPNRITPADFAGWVQERGVYYPDQWDEHFTPILACNDPGEKPLPGGLLIAPYGKGHFVYTGLAFFRQLPAGVPGAYRLFANLISLGK